MATSLIDRPVADEVEQSTLPWLYRILALSPGALTGLFMIWSSSDATATGRRFVIADDAMISMTFARTFARGGGLVWFEGAPRVEGITNPFWTFYMAFLHFIGLEGSSAALAVALTGLATVLVTALAAGRIVRSIRPGSHAAELAAIAIVPLLFPLLFWATRGMEVGLIIACTFVAAMLAVDYRNSSGNHQAQRRQLVFIAVCLGIGLATRLDFLPFAAVVIAWIIWTAQSKTERVRALLSLGLFCIALLALMSLARLLYYGDIVPNTYTLKATGVPFPVQLSRGLLMSVKIIPVVAVAACATWFGWSTLSANAKKVVVLIAAIGAVSVAYSTYTGGDAWESIANRYVQPALVAAAILVATSSTSAAAVRERSREVVLVGLTALVLLVIVGALVAFDRPGLRGSLSGLSAPLALLPIALATVISAWLVTRSESSVKVRVAAPAFALAAGLSAFYLQSDAFHPNRASYVQLLAASAMFVAVLAGVAVLDRIPESAANRIWASTLLAAALVVILLTIAMATEVGGTRLNAVRLMVVWTLVIPAVWMLPPPMKSASQFQSIFRVTFLGILLIAVAGVPGWRQWEPDTLGPLAVKHDKVWASTGDELALLTDKDAVIAHTAAGGAAYYADRRAVDLLGKMDKHIAGMEPVAEFWPGHNKYDYEWTVETYRPDVFLPFFVFTEQHVEMLKANGYSCHAFKFPPEAMVWLRDDSPKVNHSSPRIRPC